MADSPLVLQKVTRSGRRARAAVLLAEDELSDEAIAASIGVSRQTLARWKLEPGFQAAIRESLDRIRESALRFPIAKKHKRIEVLDEVHTRSLQIIRDRAERYAGRIAEDEGALAARRVFGGSSVPAEAATGLLVKKESVNNAGHRTVEWSVDVGLLKQILDYQKQAAQELGQFIEKTDNTTHMTTTVIIEAPE